MKLRFDHPLWRRWGPVLARRFIQLSLGTCAIEDKAAPEVKEVQASGRAVIFAAWHCHLLSPLYCSRQYYSHLPPLVLMASPSRDGEFIAQVARGLGFIVIPGSRQKGGVKALQALATYLRRGHSAGIVADGSRGPAREVQKGVLYLAREAQVPILPLAVAASRKLTLNTWDRFEFPLPFSRIALLSAELLQVPPEDRGAALEQRRRDLQACLNDLYRLSQEYYLR
ncbi:MAG: lysophospholipid acyltransferase family protein [Thermodesulfobacteriota bacterium]